MPPGDRKVLLRMNDACEICTTPTRDSAYVCDDCGDTYATDLKALSDVLDGELEAALAGIVGIDWRKGHTSGGGEPGLRVNWRAAAVYRRLHRALSEAVDHCLAASIRHTSTSDAEPSRTVPAMALWLTWRVDGLCLDPQGPRHIDELVNLVDDARSIVDWEAPERHFLGRCSICDGGYVYAEGDAIEAVCDRCAKAFPAEALRADLLAQLDDKLATAVEIARLSTYLGLRDNRDQVQRCISMWHHRGQLASHGQDEGWPRFRFGEVFPLLQQRERRSG